MSNRDDNKTESQSNSRENSKTDAYSTAEPHVYFHPFTNELVISPDDDFERENEFLCKLIQKKKETQAEIDKLNDSNTFKDREYNEEKYTAELNKRYAEYQQADQALFDVVNKIGKEKYTYSDYDGEFDNIIAELDVQIKDNQRVNNNAEKEIKNITDTIKTDGEASVTIDNIVNRLAGIIQSNNNPEQRIKDIVNRLAAMLKKQEEEQVNKSRLTTYRKKDNIRIVELLGIKRSGGIVYRYIRSDKIGERHEIHHLGKKESTAENKNFFRRVKERNKDGTITEIIDIDEEKLKKQFSKIEPKMRKNLFKLDGDQGTLWDWTGGLKTWAEEINKSLDSTPPGKFKYATLDNKAQIMRWSYGGQGDLELSLGVISKDSPFSTENLKAGAKVSLYANFSFAEGKSQARVHVPNRYGVEIRYPTRHKMIPDDTEKKRAELNSGHVQMMGGAAYFSDKTATLGAFRFDFSLTLSGMVGASIGLQGSVNLTPEGIKGAKLPEPSGPPSEVRGIDIAKSSDKLGANAEATVFVGLKGGGELAGDLLWYNPELTPSGRKKLAETDGFSSIAKVAVGLEIMLGGGLSGQLAITYQNGTFYFIAHGSVCWGFGAGGRTAFEVDMDVFMDQLMPCVGHMLRNIDYNKMVLLIAEKDFYILCQYPIIIGMGIIIVNTYQALEDISRHLNKLWEEAQYRTNLMTFILDDGGAGFACSPPETKGAIILSLLTDKFWDKNFNRKNHEKLACEVDGTYNARKRAILHILRWAQSIRDLDNIFQHMVLVPDGEKTDIEKGIKDVITFLSDGEEIKKIYDMRMGYNYEKSSTYNETFALLRSRLAERNMDDYIPGDPFEPCLSDDEVTGCTQWSRDGKVWKTVTDISAERNKK